MKWEFCNSWICKQGNPQHPQHSFFCIFKSRNPQQVRHFLSYDFYRIPKDAPLCALHRIIELADFRFNGRSFALLDSGGLAMTPLKLPLWGQQESWQMQAWALRLQGTKTESMGPKIRQKNSFFDFLVFYGNYEGFRVFNYSQMAN